MLDPQVSEGEEDEYEERLWLEHLAMPVQSRAKPCGAQGCSTCLCSLCASVRRQVPLTRRGLRGACPLSMLHLFCTGEVSAGLVL